LALLSSFVAADYGTQAALYFLMAGWIAVCIPILFFRPKYLRKEHELRQREQKNVQDATEVISSSDVAE